MRLDFQSGGGALRDDGSYLTIFGWNFSNSGITYGACDATVAAALENRFLNCRPGGQELEVEYRQNQYDFCHASLGFLELIREYATPHFESYTDALTEAYEHHADPHQKKQLRIAGFHELRAAGTYADTVWIDQYVLAKLKKAETAKNGKAPRIILDMGIPASLEGFRVTQFMKEALDGVLIPIDDGHVEFCKAPSPTRLREVFERLMNPPGRFYAVVHSDDSCFSVRLEEGTVRMYNLDISKNDVSHEHTFDALIHATPVVGQDDMRAACDQGLKPMRIKSLVHPERSTILAPRTRKMYSGMTITTIINSIASMLIVRSIAKDKAVTPDEIVVAAAKVGFILTIDEAVTYHELQFLKHSPVYDIDGKLQALINVGVVLRASGQCKQDLPGRSAVPLEERARQFQSALLQGLGPRCHYQFLDNLKRSCAGGTTAEAISRVHKDVLAYKFEDNDEGDSFTVESSEVFKRYKLTELMARNLEEHALELGFGKAYTGEAVNLILEKDYGLQSLSDPHSGELLDEWTWTPSMW